MPPSTVDKDELQNDSVSGLISETEIIVTCVGDGKFTSVIKTVEMGSLF